MILAPLLVCNSSLSQSTTDAQSLLTAYGLPDNRLHIAFGSGGNPNVLETQLADGTYTVAAFYYHGVRDYSFDGHAVITAIYREIPRSYTFDGVICSTLTPYPLTRSNGAIVTLPGFLALRMYTGQTGAAGDVLPNGRLGCTNTDSWGLIELVGKSGNRVVDQAITQGRAAELVYNFARPVITTSDPKGVPYGFTSAYAATKIAAFGAAGCNVISDVWPIKPLLFADGTNPPAAGTVPPVDVFAIAGGVWANSQQGSPGTLITSNNFNLQPGAWASIWFSNQWGFAMDFLWNGAVAAFMNDFEPGADGIRDPFLIMQKLLTGSSVMECLPLSAVPNSAPTYPADTNEPDRISVCGNPLYQPYKRRTPQPAGVLPLRI